MITKLFKNRIQQEDKDTIAQLKGIHINMNYDKKKHINDFNGWFLITLQPNSYVDEVTLYNDFKFILCLYYRWMYGTGWNKRHHLQFKWEGIIERQAGNHNHIHFMIFEDNIEKLAIFLGYIKTIFKQLYPKASFDFQGVYDWEGCFNYINPFSSKNRKEIFYLNSIMLQKQINTNGTLKRSN